MKISVTSPASLKKTPLLFVPAFAGESVDLPTGVDVPAAFTKGFEAAARTTRESFTSGGPAAQVVLIGCGDRGALDMEGLRRLGAVMAKKAEALGVAKATILATDLQGLEGIEDCDAGQALAEGAVLGTYRYTELKSEAKAAKCKAIAVAADGATYKRGVARGSVMAAACSLARDLQNKPGNVLTPTAFAAAARKVAAGSPRITCKVIDEAGMKKMGMGLFLSVSQGSDEPAKLVHLTYKPKGKAKGRITLVGKGLTFDAGGVSIKPSGKMDEMRFDMSGAAAVLGAFRGLAELDLPLEIHGILGCSENTINGKATKPGDVHTAMDGTTVEILNTDAEGRLVLADCLVYAARRTKPDTMLDLATLTGAVIVGIGHEVSGIFPSTDELRDALVASGLRTGEKCWPLPLLQEHLDAMKGTSADLANIGSPAVGAGSSQGAAFLRGFVPQDVAWCHLDIAGTAWNTVNRDWVGGPTGSGVGARLILDYLFSRS